MGYSLRIFDSSDASPEQCRQAEQRCRKAIEHAVGDEWLVRPTYAAWRRLVAADSCTAQADAKKLAGAARTSFVKKCETDSGAAGTCDDKAAEKKLAGAAKTSFLKKCESDAKAAGGNTCETQAKEKKLAGAA